MHTRSAERLAAVKDLVDRDASVVVEYLADPGQTRDVAAQVNRLGPAEVPPSYRCPSTWLMTSQPRTGPMA